MPANKTNNPDLVRISARVILPAVPIEAVADVRAALKLMSDRYENSVVELTVAEPFRLRP